MNSRSIIILVIAAAFALFVAFFVRGQISGNSIESVAQEESSTRILVARKTISAGSFIRADGELEWIDWPKENLNPNYLVENRAELKTFDGAVAKRQITKGEPLTAKLVVQAGEGGFMAAVLTPGMRAISIAVDSTTGNAGFIFPGDRVDLILTHRVEPMISADIAGGNGENMLASETFIKDVRILAVDQKLDNPENTAMLAKTVTIEVTETQAEKVNLAKDLGKISLSLRSLTSQQTDDPMALSQVGRYQAPEKATRGSDVSTVLSPNSAQSVRRVTVIRGNSREMLEFER